MTPLEQPIELLNKKAPTNARAFFRVESLTTIQ